MHPEFLREKYGTVDETMNPTKFDWGTAKIEHIETAETPNFIEEHNAAKTHKAITSIVPFDLNTAAQLGWTGGYKPPFLCPVEFYHL